MYCAAAVNSEHCTRTRKQIDIDSFLLLFWLYDFIYLVIMVLKLFVVCILGHYKV
jgi:hypothetical protein